jgi:CheY-like chemotaxis protein
MSRFDVPSLPGVPSKSPGSIWLTPASSGLPVTRNRPQTILFVSPEPGLRSVVGQLLREDGYRVLEAADGLSALRLLECHPVIDLAITETRTPVLNGWQFAAAARRIRPCLPLLRVTAPWEEQPLDAMVELPLLEKPFTILELVGAVRELLKPACEWPRSVEPVGRLRCTPPPRFPLTHTPARARGSAPSFSGSPALDRGVLARGAPEAECPAG